MGPFCSPMETNSEAQLNIHMGKTRKIVLAICIHLTFMD